VSKSGHFLTCFLSHTGTGPNENQGNKIFRDVLRKHREEYRVAATRREKREVVSKALKEFKAKGGRFVEKVGQHGEESPPTYEVVEGTAVSLKARQAFLYLLRGGDSKKRLPQKNQKPQQAPGTPPTSSSSSSQPFQCGTHTGSHGTRLPQSIIFLAQESQGLQQGRMRETTSSSSRELDLQRLASLTVESPILAGLQASPYLINSLRNQLSPISESWFANTSSDLRNSMLTSHFVHGGNTRVTPRSTNGDLRIGGDLVGQLSPLLSSISPFASRASILESSLGTRLSDRGHPLLVRNCHSVDDALFNKIDTLISHSVILFSEESRHKT
jgi:hypothetical protein